MNWPSWWEWELGFTLHVEHFSTLVYNSQHILLRRYRKHVRISYTSEGRYQL